MGAVIVILGPAALRRYGLPLLKLMAAKTVPALKAYENVAWFSLILWRPA
jgi:hypothetical protein